jgi:hypothetical protein
LTFSALRHSGWADAIAPETELEVQVLEVSPKETLKKRRLKQLLA